jgi:predicted amidohydrolase
VQDLTVTLVQCELAWEQPADNRQQFESLISGSDANADLIVLPEMFTTGFSMNALANAEPPDGDTERWMQGIARSRNCAITGSIAVREGDNVFNRLLFATPDTVHYYDKRHLFRMAGEHKRYSAGKERVVLAWRDWRIKPEICYDLRFPVFSRNREDYDALLYVANWPARRAAHWRSLLIARAIENQACVVGVNRIGADANGLTYSGDSLAIDARGELLADLRDRPEVCTVTFSAADLKNYRESFPCHMDADTFSLEE